MGGGIKVHGVPISTATMRVLATLYEKGLDFEIVPVDMKAGAHKQEPLISLNAFSSKPKMLIFWAWPCKICESVIHLAGPPNLKPLFDDLLSVAKMQRISGGFTGAFILSLMPYFSFTKNSLPVGSPVWSLSSPTPFYERRGIPELVVEFRFQLPRL
ncbi:hypothetical protein DY000_02028266 [Brassica cretica]|uniref:glutathione transferase n=1 Tax=Brassica cretica TaxID=69181 RepID=A0ABQ7DHC5_BRACR|nr:hypothetical protein DY000_02028266 [Brassica cretica]